MATTAAAPAIAEKLSRKSGTPGMLVFFVVLLAGVGYVGYQLATDLSKVKATSIFPFLLLGLALFVALGFEFVNGFHDTANAAFTILSLLGLRQLVGDIGNETAIYKELAKVPNERIRNFRNDMYLMSEALRLMQKSGRPQFNAVAILKNYKEAHRQRDEVYPHLGESCSRPGFRHGDHDRLETNRCNGERIGKSHLAYAQGGAAEITAMATIGAADYFGLPVSTTHVLSSGVAGIMAANRSGLQWGTVRNLALAWVLTLPAAMLLSGFLFWAFRAALK